MQILDIQYMRDIQEPTENLEWSLGRYLSIALNPSKQRLLIDCWTRKCPALNRVKFPEVGACYSREQSGDWMQPVFPYPIDMFQQEREDRVYPRFLKPRRKFQMLDEFMDGSSTFPMYLSRYDSALEMTVLPPLLERCLSPISSSSH